MFTLILLAGGQGLRMGSTIPKQFLPLNGLPLALHSFNTLKALPEVRQVIVVCAPQWQHFFSPPVSFALPGSRRQDSVYSGLLQATEPFVLIHDAARPFVEVPSLLFEAALRTGAAALATPVASTIKQASASLHIEKTLDRSHLWELQTPQAIRKDLLLRAFDFAHKHNLAATDDLSLIEAIGHPAEIVPGSPKNFKITTSTDFALAQVLCATN